MPTRGRTTHRRRRTECRRCSLVRLAKRRFLKPIGSCDHYRGTIDGCRSSTPARRYFTLPPPGVRGPFVLPLRQLLLPPAVGEGLEDRRLADGAHSRSHGPDRLRPPGVPEGGEAGSGHRQRRAVAAERSTPVATTSALFVVLARSVDQPDRPDARGHGPDP